MDGNKRSAGEALGENATTTVTRQKRFSGASTVVTTTTVIVTTEMLRAVHEWKDFEEYQAKDELVLTTLSFLNVSDVLKLKRVCRKWKNLCISSIKSNFLPKKAIKANQELRDAIQKYCQYDPKIMDELAPVYGYPIDKWDVSELEDFTDAFAGCHGFNEYIGSWNVSKAKIMKFMFARAGFFNQCLAGWDTSSVINMRGMFYHATNFNQCLTSWDTSSVENMAEMFEIAAAFNQSLEDWDTSSVENMAFMFCRACNFNQSLATWNCNRVTNNNFMFDDADAFSHFDSLPQELQDWEGVDD